jgi:polyisoprenoid-binding protein YceI
MRLPARLFRLVLPALLAALATTASAAPENHEIDASHSAILFRVQHANAGYQYGRFNDFAGTVVFDAADPAACKVNLEIKAGTIDTNNPKRDEHLRSAEYFDVKQFPTITFASTAVAKVGDTTYDVTGNLTLHGVTKPVTLRMEKVGEAKDPWGNYRRGFEGTVTIKRSEFAMKNALEVVGDDVRLTLAIEVIRK